MARLLFKDVVAYAEKKGIIVERYNDRQHSYEAYRKDDHSTVALADTLPAIVQDVNDLAD